MAGSIVTKGLVQDVIGGTTQPLYLGGVNPNGSDAKLTVATDGSISTATPLTVPSLTVNSKPVMSSLLAEYTVTGSAVTSIDFSGLDINTHKSYRVECNFYNSSAYTFDIYCFVNNNTTATNYYTQNSQMVNTTVSAFRVNYPRICICYPSFSAKSDISIYRTVDSYFKGFISTSPNDASTAPFMEFNSILSTFTLSNITQLTFTSTIGSSIGVGSTIRIYRSDV